MPPNHLRRVKRIALVLAVAALALAACQPAPAPVEATATRANRATPLPTYQRTSRPSDLFPTRTPAPASRISVQAEDLRDVDVHVWHQWSGAAAAEIETLVSDFNHTNSWGIRVLLSRFADYSVIREAVKTSEGKADILIAPLYHLRTLDQEGISLSDLEPYLQDPIWGLDAEEQNDLYPVFWQQGITGNRRIAVPAHSSGSLIYYNQTWANELGFTTPPRTAAQFEEQACAAARANQTDDQRENDGSGGWIINTSYTAALSWLHAYGAEIQEPEDGYQFNTTPVRQAFTFLRELYEQGCAWLPEDEFVEEEFASRRGLFASGTLLGIPYQEDAFADAGSQDDWIVLPYPGRAEPGAITVYGDSYALISTTPRRQLASWLFIRWMLQPKNQARLIVKTGAYPLNGAALAEMQARIPLKQWQQAVDLLEIAHSEPDLASWLSVRWAVSDVTTQLFRWYFTLDQLPAALRLLDQTAVELHQLSTGSAGAAP